MKFTNKEILDTIERIEGTIKPSLFVFDGVNYWPAIRIRIAFGLVEKRYSEKKRSARLLFSKFIKCLMNKNNYSFNSSKFDVLFVSHSNYKIHVDDDVYDRVLEGYKNEYKKREIDYAELNLDTFGITYNDGNKENSSICFNMMIVKFVAYIYSYFLSYRIKGVTKHIAGINHFLKTHLDGYELTERDIVVYLSYLSIMRTFFKKYMFSLGVKEVYQAMYYDPVGLAINSAASALNVSKYCAQHGGQSINNPAFGRWTNIPLNGYGMLPNVFLCWDQGSADNIQKWSSVTTSHTARVDGYKWAELWRNDEIPYKEISSVKNRSAGYFNILYTLQPSVSMIPRIIRNMISDNEINARWWLRLHPRQIGTDIHRELLLEYKENNNVIVNVATSEPLPVIMSNMDLHITSFSSCVYEALLFDVFTIFVDESGKEYFNDLIEENNAKCILDDNELKDYIVRSSRNGA